MTATATDSSFSISYLEEMLAKCREESCDRLLLVRDIHSMLPTGELFFTFERFSKMSRGIKISFVIPYPELFEKMNLAIMIADNRGANFAYFPDEESAERWLLD